MAGPYSYAERVANRAHAAAEHTPPTTTSSRTTTSRTTATTISDAEWNEILLMEQAIHSFEERFEEFMRSQSRLMEDFRVELDDSRAELDHLRAELFALRTAVKSLETRMLGLEEWAKECDLPELWQRLEALKLEASAILRADDRLTRAEVNFAKHEALLERFFNLAERFRTLEDAIAEMRERQVRVEDIGSTSQASAVGSVANQDNKLFTKIDATATEPEKDRWPALRVFLQALDQFGEDLNGFSVYEDESNLAEQSS